MTVKDLQRLYDYGYWANRKLFAVLVQLTPEEFTRPVAGSYGSVRNTMVHIMSAEWGWVDRCGGPPRGPALKADAYPTVDALRSAWDEVEKHVRTFLRSLTDDDLRRDVEFKSFFREGNDVMRLGDLLQHGANHGVHHRGQVALLLRLLGRTPGNFDLLFYDAESSPAAR
jgi:uncharacterized damage-inducible protein DinB